MIRKIERYLFILRSDKGFAKSGIYKISEKNNILYTTRLKANAILYDLVKLLVKKLIQKNYDYFYEKQVVYKRFNYKTVN